MAVHLNRPGSCDLDHVTWITDSHHRLYLTRHLEPHLLNWFCNISADQLIPQFVQQAALCLHQSDQVDLYPAFRLETGDVDQYLVYVHRPLTRQCEFTCPSSLSSSSSQSSMSSSSSSAVASAPTPFQSAGSYGLFNRAPVPAYNQFSSSPLVSPQFGPVGVGECSGLEGFRAGHEHPRVQGRLCDSAPR